MKRNNQKAAAGCPRGLPALLVVLCLIASNLLAREQPDAFSSQPVWEIKLTISPENVERLRKEARKDVRATVEVFDSVFENVAVHLKGTGTFQPIDKKPSFTVNFAKFSPGRHLRGSTKIHLNNSLQDATFLREQLGAEIMRAAGMPAPRVSRAQVELNGKPLGFYVVKEGFTPEFLESSLGTNGTLLEPGKGQDIDRPMDEKWGHPDKIETELRRLARAVKETNLEKRWELLNEVADLKRFAALLAAEVMICHWDGYALGPNNYRVYYNHGPGKFVFLPAGMDQIFGKADLPWNPPMSGQAARAFMQTPQGRQLYRSTFEELFAKQSAESLARRIEEILQSARPFAGRSEFKEMQREAKDLMEVIAAREEHLRMQMAEPEPPLLSFKEGAVLVEGWKPFDVPSGGRMESLETIEAAECLGISAGEKSAATWRAKIRLKPGVYQFKAKVKVTEVNPLPFGKHHGACVRVAGRGERSKTLTGSTNWEWLSTNFNVTLPEEEVVLVCELRASGGEAYFQKDSLVVAAIDQRSGEGTLARSAESCEIK